MELCLLLLLLLSSSITWSQSEELSFLAEEQHNTEGYKLLRKWEALDRQLSLASRDNKANTSCSASPNETYAYFVLGELFEYHDVDGVIDFFLRRRTGYSAHFALLLAAMETGEDGKPKVTFCNGDFHSFVCLSGSCVSCDSLTTTDDAILAAACRLSEEGEMGGLIPLDEVPPVAAQAPQSIVLQKSPEDEEMLCSEGKGWLSVQDLRKWHHKMTGAADYEKRRDMAECTFSLELEAAFSLLDRVLLKKNDATLKNEIAEYREFYEDTLWMFRGGRNLDFTPCFHELVAEEDEEEDGPWICGMDAACVNCIDVLDTHRKFPVPSALISVCNATVPRNWRKKSCEGRSSTPSEGSGTSGYIRDAKNRTSNNRNAKEPKSNSHNSGVRREGGLLLIAMAFAFQTGRTFTTTTK